MSRTLSLAMFAVGIVASGSVTWTDLTEASVEGFSNPHHRRLAIHNEAAPFVRRRPSATVKVFELSHPKFHTLSVGDKTHATHFHYPKLGLGHGSKVDLPLCTTGKAQSFHLEHSDLVGPELRTEFPDIAAFHGTSIEDPSITADVTFTPIGIRAQIWTNDTLCYVDPYSTSRADLYTSYSRADETQEGNTTPREIFSRFRSNQRSRRLQAAWTPDNFPDQTKLYSFKLGLAVTPAYATWAQQHGGAMSTVTTSLVRPCIHCPPLRNT